MHFNKEPGPGTSFTSQAEVGFFVEDRPVAHQVITDTLGNNGFEIPPNHPRYRVGMARTLEKDILVLNLCRTRTCARSRPATPPSIPTAPRSCCSTCRTTIRAGR